MVTPRSRGPSDWSFALLLCTTAFAFTAIATLVYVLWKVVPYHAAVYEGKRVNLPKPTLYAVALSNWLVRLLPLLYLTSGPAAALLVVAGLSAVAFFGAPLLRIVRVAAAVTFILGLGASGCAIFVLHALEQAYR